MLNFSVAHPTARFGRYLSASVCAAHWLVMCTSLSAQATGQTVRDIPWDPDQTIESRLLAGDGVVSIYRHLYVGEPATRMSWEQVVSDATARADVVAAVDVKQVVGVLAEEGTWINTRLVGSVVQVLFQSSGRHVVSGAMVEAEISGGEMMIGAVRVRAGEKPELATLKQNQAYLLFLTSVSGVLYPTHTPLYIHAGRLVYPWRYEVSNQPLNPLEGHTVDEIAAAVRRSRR